MQPFAFRPESQEHSHEAGGPQVSIAHRERENHKRPADAEQKQKVRKDHMPSPQGSEKAVINTQADPQQKGCLEKQEGLFRWNHPNSLRSHPPLWCWLP